MNTCNLLPIKVFARLHAYSEKNTVRISNTCMQVSLRDSFPFLLLVTWSRKCRNRDESPKECYLGEKVSFLLIRDRNPTLSSVFGLVCEIERRLSFSPGCRTGFCVRFHYLLPILSYLTFQQKTKRKREKEGTTSQILSSSSSTTEPQLQPTPQ